MAALSKVKVIDFKRKLSGTVFKIFTSRLRELIYGADAVKKTQGWNQSQASCMRNVASCKLQDKKINVVFTAEARNSSVRA